MSFQKGCWILFCVVGVMAAQAEPLIIENEVIKVCCQSETGRFRVIRADSDETIAEGVFNEVTGPARVVGVEDAFLGQGQAITVAGVGGRNARLQIFPSLPFVVFQGTLHHMGGKDIEINEVPLVTLELSWPGLADEVATLGTGGLMPAAQALGSYVWMAVANPSTRAGVVTGWLTQEQACGVIFPSVKAGRVSLMARADYGHLLMEPGQDVDTESFVLGIFNDTLQGLETWADLVARKYDIQLKEPLSGYCTWYADENGGAGDAGSLEVLMNIAAEKLGAYGMDVIQIDDGWQQGDAQGNGPDKNFTEVDPNGPYPKGMLAMSNRIRALDMTAGLFCMPFSGTYNDPWFADRQDLFVKNVDGTPFDTAWAGTALDLSKTQTQDYVRDVIRRLCEEWSYGYLKVAGLFSGLAAHQVYPNTGYRDDDFGQVTFADETRTPIEIYRQGLTLVREAAGPETYLLGSTLAQNMRPYGASFGLVDAMRIGLDTGGTWQQWSQRAPVYGARHYFLNNRIWHNDPDAVFARDTLSLNQARAMCSWTSLSGQLFVNSDWLPGLSEERWEVLRRTMDNPKAISRPIDLFEREPAQVWMTTDNDGPVRRDVVGLYNWQLPAQTLEVSPQSLGLPQAEAYAAFDFWGDRFLPPCETIRVPVTGQSCRVLAVRPAQTVPQLLSTSRHVSQGMIDVLAETWDADSQTLQGTSRVEAADPYELRMIVPVAKSSWRVRDVKVEDDSVQVDWRQQGPGIRVTLTRPEAAEVDWAVTFEKDRVSRPEAPQKITLFTAESDTDEIRLSWKPCRADVYRLTRQDGRQIETKEAQWVDRDVKPDTPYVYQVQAVVWDQASTATEVSMRTKK